MSKLRPIILLQSAVFGAALLVAACGGSSGKDIKGTVTAADANAKTFTVKATNGQTYNFVMDSSSKGSMDEIAGSHLKNKEQIEVKYKGSSSPYTVVSAD